MRQLERSGTVWIGIDDNSSTDNTSADVLFSEYCPYNYCKRDKINIFDSTDLQCQTIMWAGCVESVLKERALCLEHHSVQIVPILICT